MHQDHACAGSSGCAWFARSQGQPRVSSISERMVNCWRTTSRSMTLKAAATRLTGGWQTKVEAHNTAKSIKLSERIQRIWDRAN
jgi:hypothetical protein